MIFFVFFPVGGGGEGIPDSWVDILLVAVSIWTTVLWLKLEFFVCSTSWN